MRFPGKKRREAAPKASNVDFDHYAWEEELKPLGTSNDDLVVKLPADPTQDDLEGAGWPIEIAEELCTLDEAAPVKRNTVNAVTRNAIKLLGIKAKEAKTMFADCFEALGVDVAKKKVPNGYQLRMFGVLILTTNTVAA